jgi:hypothetical protein
MTFSKRFPRELPGSTYPKWEEITLTASEENVEEARAREQNIKVMKECIDDAKALATEKNLKPFETSVVTIAVSLFEKRASHVVYFKEQKAKDKFDAVSLKT